MFRKMRHKLLLCLIFVFAVFALSLPYEAFSGPAYDGLFEIRQPSGNIFKSKKRGDERHHWVETEEGYCIFKNRFTAYQKLRRNCAKGNKHVSYSNDAAWEITAIDAPKYTDNFSSKFIAVDTDGSPHIAYGGDHLYYAYYDGSAWQFETVDASPGVGDYASIAINTSGKVHISYYDFYNDILKYATNSSGKWVISTVDNRGGIEGDSSIALDNSDNVHICYHRGGKSSLTYATNVSGKWKSEKLEEGNTSGSSLIIDKSDNIHISYFSFNGTNYYLKYVTNTSGSWEKTKIGEVESTGNTSIAIDSSGNTHICYYTGNFVSVGDIKYTTNSSGSWNTTTIVEDYAFENVSITVDVSDYVHISFSAGDFENVIYSVYYATNVSGTWVITEVDEGNGSSLALDVAGKVHIGYYSAGIKYATNVLDSMNTTTVDGNIADAGYFNSIAIDSLDKVHIVYRYRGNDDQLKYATDISGSWTISTVDSGSVGDGISLALDTSGKAHISYLDHGGYQISNEHDLKYATNAFGNWVIKTIDSSGQIDGGTSIAVDSSSNVYITYYNHNGHIKYATNISGDWKIETVDSVSSVEGSPSIALDTLGNAHISYDGYGDLKYATNVSGKWETQILDDLKSGQTGDYSSITVDKLGNIHISYHEIYSGKLRYVTNVSGNWIVETIDKYQESDNRDVEGRNSLELDSSGNVHISYYKADDRYGTNSTILKYATNLTGDWFTTTVDSEVHVGGDNSLAIDSSNKVHISYYDVSDKDLKYATGVYKGVFLGMIYGSITDTEGVPIESVKVKLKGKGSNAKVKKKYTTDEDGAYEFSDLEEGTYIIQAKKKGYQKAKERIKLSDGEDKEEGLVLEKK